MKQPTSYPMGARVRGPRGVGTVEKPEDHSSGWDEFCWIEYDDTDTLRRARWADVEIDNPEKSLKTTAVSELTDATWLTMGKQAAKRTKGVAMKMLGDRVPEPMRGWLSAQLDTDVGLGVYAIGFGALMSAVPRVTSTANRARLASSMRVWGLHVLTDGMIDPVLDSLLGIFDGVLDSHGAAKE